jgi:hypothetical protein|tara:strand:+ start:1674 stop:2027 length:354 start_codon:yes stop_codon:yes gene_type:complete
MKDEDKKSRVFVVQEVSRFNIVSAQQYGQLIPIYEEGKQIFLSPGPATRKAKNILRDFSDNDYLLLIGDPAMIGLATSVAAYHNRGKYKVLKYDRRTFTYLPIQIDLNERNSHESES